MSFTDLQITDIPIDIGIITIWSLGYDRIPNKWLWCNGDEKLKSQYAKLFEIIGDKYGPPTSADKFKLPDLNASVVIGKSTNTTIGKKIGSNQIQISASMLPQHNHNITVSSFTEDKEITTVNNNNHTHTMDNAGSHTHSFDYNTDEGGNGTNAIVLSGNRAYNYVPGGAQSLIPMQDDGSHSHGRTGDTGAHFHNGSVNINHEHTASANSWPNNATQNNLGIIQSSVVMIYIIKAKM